MTHLAGSATLIKVMKTTFLNFCFILITIAPAQIPLPLTPDWTSVENDYSTGGTFADINGDGYLDFCITNGNDMASNYNSVYLNNHGNLETNASWRSSDQGFFGHCYSGDVNNDGHPDLAVAYLGDYNGPSELRARIYRNNGTALEPLPYWKSKDSASSFDCCLGDFDIDGDLDLAISTGDAYRGQLDRTRIYRNNSGFFDTLPCWQAKLDTASDAIRFVDVDIDGDLDLFVGHRRKVVMYRNQNGVFDTVPEWTVRRGIGWVLRMEPGDYDQDGYLDLAIAANDQLEGDPNSIRVFHNNSGTLDTIPAFIMQRRGTRLYSSCVAWGDANGDGYPELAAGGWWHPVVVYANNNGILDTLPTWSWSPANPQDLVCEALIWTDVANRHLIPVTDIINGNGMRKLFNFSRRPIQFLDSVKVNGAHVPVSAFCFDPLVGWISFATPPPVGSGNVILYYRYSTHPDLAVTNWDSDAGNHLFLNTTATAIAERSSRPQKHLRVYPNPGSGPFLIVYPEDPPTELHIYAQDGRLIQKLTGNREQIRWDGTDETGRTVVPGVYLIVAPDYQRVKLIRF